MRSWWFLFSGSKNELVGGGRLNMGTGCISGWGTTTWAPITETAMPLLDIAGTRLNDFTFHSHVQILIPNCGCNCRRGLAKTRSHQRTALAIPSSGIAATLLDGAQTAHSTFWLH
ncbi:hypothetical protein TNCV_796171 [Trichonephila clavipes]|nr:hypothetical protein TNCV_796171 [Trichonephila clavipes]